MSPKKCVFGCEGKLSLFSFPKNLELRKQWMQFVFPGEQRSIAYVFVCSRHFGDECFTNKAQFDAGFAHRLQLTDGSVPAIKYPCHQSDPQAASNPSHDPLDPDYTPLKLPHTPGPSRKKEKVNRNRRSLKRALPVELSVPEEDVDVTEVKSYSDVCVGTDLTMKDIEDMQKLNACYREQVRRIQILTCESKELKSDVELKCEHL